MVRALGDSVTAAFGFHADGSPVDDIAETISCRPKPSLDNRCSSPEAVAYPALWAAAHGIDLQSEQFSNEAVSGSSPADWLTGSLRDELNDIVADNPDVVLMTLGANPLLTDFVFGKGDQWCMRTDLTGNRTRRCVLKKLEEYDVVRNLSKVYSAVAQAPDALVGVLLYHETRPLTVPKSKSRILFSELNAAVSTAFSKARRSLGAPAADRLRLIDPGAFGEHGCMSDDPWVLIVDTCIHPNAEGQQAFAIAVESRFGSLLP